MAPPLAQRVVQRVAAATETDPTELDPPLHAVVDPDALDRIFDPTVDGPATEQGIVRFPYQGYKITVTAEGDVQLHDSE